MTMDKNLADDDFIAELREVVAQWSSYGKAGQAKWLEHAADRLTALRGVDYAEVIERALLAIEEVLQATPERGDFVDDLAAQQDQALIEIHEISQKALAAIRAQSALPAPAEDGPTAAEVIEWMRVTPGYQATRCDLEYAVAALTGTKGDG